MRNIFAFLATLLFLGSAAAQPVTTKPSFTDMLIANCTATQFLIGGATSPGCGPTPTRAGDVPYFNGTAWATLAGNNSGTNCLSENSSGVPSWGACSGGGGGSPGGSSGQVQYNNAGAFGGFTVSGDATLNTGTGALTLASTITAGGPTGSATVAPIITYDAKGRLTTVSSATITPAVGSITGFGTGVATFLATPSSANLRGALTDESGTGLAYFQGGDLGTPSAGVLTNASGTAASLTAGNATKLATTRAIAITGSTGLTATGQNFDGSAAINLPLAGTLAVANGGTGDTGTAWTTFTPTATCGTGSLTTSSSVAAYKQIGKLVFIRIAFTITTVGTCTGALSLSLPVNPLATTEMSVIGRDAGTGVIVGGRIRSDATPNNSITSILDYSGAATIIAGRTLAFDGIYEAN